MIYDLYRCKVFGEEKVLTKQEFDEIHDAALKKHRADYVKFGSWCGVRYDDKPEPQSKAPKRRKRKHNAHVPTNQ